MKRKEISVLNDLISVVFFFIASHAVQQSIVVPCVRYMHVFRWFNFEKVVQELVAADVYYLKLDQLEEIIRNVCYIETESEAAVMLNFYHDLGKIVKHHNTVILRAKWLIDVFKKLVTICPNDELVRIKCEVHDYTVTTTCN